MVTGPNVQAFPTVHLWYWTAGGGFTKEVKSIDERDPTRPEYRTDNVKCFWFQDDLELTLPNGEKICAGGPFRETGAYYPGWVVPMTAIDPNRMTAEAYETLTAQTRVRSGLVIVCANHTLLRLDAGDKVVPPLIDDLPDYLRPHLVKHRSCIAA